LQEFQVPITAFTNMYGPDFPESSYEITLPMPLPAGYTIFGECGEKIEVTDYDYNVQYRSDIVFSLNETREDLEVTSLKPPEGKKWAMILKTKNTFKIAEPLTVTVVAKVIIFCRMFISKYTLIETPFKELFIYDTCFNSVTTCPVQRMLSEVAALGYNKNVPLQVKNSVL
jgi:hypothetical protein